MVDIKFNVLILDIIEIKKHFYRYYNTFQDSLSFK